MTMAAIYDAVTGAPITEGLPGCKICDEAQIVARCIAARCNLFVLLSDDDGDWIVKPNGDCELLEDRQKMLQGIEVEQDAADLDSAPG